MRQALRVGESYPPMQHTVSSDLLVPHILPGSPLETGEPVLASGYLLALCEAACWRALRQVQGEDEAIVGTRFGFSHLSPAASGDTLSITPTCTGVSDRGDVDWVITAVHTDTSRPVGIMWHRSRIVDRDRFRARLARLLASP